MKKLLKQQRGITLVELLAVIVIGGIVMVLILSIFSNGNKTYQNQTARSEQITDMRYIAKVVTKEIRMTDKVSIVNGDLVLGSNEKLVFSLDNGQIKKDEEVIASNIAVLAFHFIDRTLLIEIESKEGNSNSQKLSTEIYLREGVIIE
ncbi:prepilin-type N-terminal cleavage/methylation domain-containing protein [Planomicrobium stackebrandtii]|uniref:Prepilin-type N-terminal cleavage/methylation domain-containing protein n=1 Tax=Planomicrobium stackebrandtii TaxID=253160 RepID=A0ABU0GYV1_9BACL|nr:prepilin-type N-terminal cleavage/methylation domain-containing protein [Planomicrobium stackebrandtii]MDQ0430533.1 prepilin-type N-terminal cleavage/methylation domain-containing protein [Planomicrobium stackebrandtii]